MRTDSRCSRLDSGKLSRLRLVTGFRVQFLFDELEYRDMVRIVMRNGARRREGRNGDHRNTRAVAKVIQRLHIAGVIITAALVKGDQDSRLLIP